MGSFVDQRRGYNIGCRMAYLFTYSPSAPSGLSVSICPSSVRIRRRPCPSIFRFPGALAGGGGVNTPSQVARYLIAGVLT